MEIPWSNHNDILFGFEVKLLEEHVVTTGNDNCYVFFQPWGKLFIEYSRLDLVRDQKEENWLINRSVHVLASRIAPTVRSCSCFSEVVLNCKPLRPCISSV